MVGNFHAYYPRLRGILSIVKGPTALMNHAQSREDTRRERTPANVACLAPKPPKIVQTVEGFVFAEVDQLRAERASSIDTGTDARPVPAQCFRPTGVRIRRIPHEPLLPAVARRAMRAQRPTRTVPIAAIPPQRAVEGLVLMLFFDRLGLSSQHDELIASATELVERSAGHPSTGRDHAANGIRTS